MQIDLKVAQLLSSRLCHDLVGPIGAVNTGLELMEEDSDDDGAALGLMARSAAEAIRRLAFYRMAFGLGGAGGGAALDEARAKAQEEIDRAKAKATEKVDEAKQKAEDKVNEKLQEKLGEEGGKVKDALKGLFGQ